MPPPPPFAQAVKTGGSILRNNKKFNLMLFGAPGVGKGTFGKLIQRDFDFKAFSTGDYFREVIKMSK
jgi:adenylate kinase